MNHRKNGIACSALLAALLLGGCDGGGPLATESPARAQFSMGGSKQRLVKGSDGAGTTYIALVGPEGADYRYDGHRLVIPPNAVAGPTFFAATLTHDDAIAVELTATSAGSAILNDVGAAGFAVPLRLSLSYKKIGEGVDPAKLRISYMSPDGNLLPLTTSLEKDGKLVVADLDHFSGYAVTTGREESTDGSTP